MTVAPERRSPVAMRVECRRPLRQAGEKGRLCDRQLARGGPEIRVAGAFDAHNLVAIGRQAQVQREDVALRLAMFQPDGNDCLAQLNRNTTRPAGGA